MHLSIRRPCMWSPTATAGAGPDAVHGRSDCCESIQLHGRESDSISDGEPCYQPHDRGDDNTLWIAMSKCNLGVRAATRAIRLPDHVQHSKGCGHLIEPYIGDATGIAAVTGLPRSIRLKADKCISSRPWTAPRLTTSSSQSRALPTTWPTWMD